MVVVKQTVTPNTEHADALLSGYRALVEELEDRGWLEPATAQAALDAEEIAS